MVQLVWCWRQGDSTIFTKNSDVAQRAVKAGYCVSIKTPKAHVYRN